MRYFYTLLILLASTFLFGQEKADSVERSVAKQVQPLIGAIRWDAWYGRIPKDVPLTNPHDWPGTKPESKVSPDPGAETCRSLTPECWAWRRPFFAQHDEKGQLIELNGNRQEVIDQEIDYAAYAGLDYWAFTVYPEDCPLSRCFKKYISSAKKDKVKFCFFLVLGSSYGNFCVDPKMQEYVLRYITDKDYLKVQGNRPVLYVGFFNKAIDEIFQSGFWEKYCARIKALGLGRPYVILSRGTNVQRAKPYLEKYNADALGNYCIADQQAQGAPFQTLVDKTVKFANDCREAGVNTAPLCTAGWDRRPRAMNPVSWETYFKKGEGLDRYIASGSAEEIAKNIGNMRDWLIKNPNSDGTNLILIYAWNECDEGGWLIPTLPEPRGHGTQRIDALHKILRAGKASF